MADQESLLEEPKEPTPNAIEVFFKTVVFSDEGWPKYGLEPEWQVQSAVMFYPVNTTPSDPSTWRNLGFYWGPKGGISFHFTPESPVWVPPHQIKAIHFIYPEEEGDAD